MIINLQQLVQHLQEVQAQLQTVAKHACHHGVAQQLARVQILQQDMLGTVQVGAAAAK